MVTNTTWRTFLATSGSASVAILAGCIGSGDDSDEPTDDESDGFEISSGTTIVLDGYSSHWEGIEPSEIEGVENPTLVLSEGEEYEIEWINADNIVHNLEIHDTDGQQVDTLVTEDIQEEGERSEPLSFTASENMSEYICNYHPVQRGDLIVE